MLSSWRTWLYVAVGATAVVLLAAGVPVSTVLTVVFVAAMVLMHLGGHGGHGGHGSPGTEAAHRHGSEDARPVSGR